MEKTRPERENTVPRGGDVPTKKTNQHDLWGNDKKERCESTKFTKRFFFGDFLSIWKKVSKRRGGPRRESLAKKRERHSRHSHWESPSDNSKLKESLYSWKVEYVEPKGGESQHGLKMPMRVGWGGGAGVVWGYGGCGWLWCWGVLLLKVTLYQRSPGIGVPGG